MQSGPMIAPDGFTSEVAPGPTYQQDRRYVSDSRYALAFAAFHPRHGPKLIEFPKWATGRTR